MAIGDPGEPGDVQPTKANDGGPAFPQWVSIGDRAVSQGGLSLRDYFAAAALPAVIAYHDRGLAQEDELPEAAVARDAYSLADALLAERERAS
jgi:hypothetical protein